MSNPLYNKFGGNYHQNGNNIFSQLAQIKNNPGAILDILLQNGKITQTQYNELQPFSNNPQQIVNYLLQHGSANQKNQTNEIIHRLGNL